MGFSRQESWSGLPFPSPGDLPDPGIKPMSPALQGDSLPSEPPEKVFSCLDSGYVFLAGTVHGYCPVPGVSYQELHKVCLSHY